MLTLKTESGTLNHNDRKRTDVLEPQSACHTCHHSDSLSGADSNESFSRATHQLQVEARKKNTKKRRAQQNQRDIYRQEKTKETDETLSTQQRSQALCLTFQVWHKTSTDPLCSRDEAPTMHMHIPTVHP